MVAPDLGFHNPPVHVVSQRAFEASQLWWQLGRASVCSPRGRLPDPSAQASGEGQASPAPCPAELWKQKRSGPGTGRVTPEADPPVRLSFGGGSEERGEGLTGSPDLPRLPVDRLQQELWAARWSQ